MQESLCREKPLRGRLQRLRLLKSNGVLAGGPAQRLVLLGNEAVQVPAELSRHLSQPITTNLSATDKNSLSWQKRIPVTDSS